MTRKKQGPPPPVAAGPNAYFLHVANDGRELHFNYKPDLPCLYVEQLTDGTEQTRTPFRVTAVQDAAVTMAAAPPRGRGVMHDNNSSDKHAIWRRVRS